MSMGAKVAIIGAVAGGGVGAAVALGGKKKTSMPGPSGGPPFELFGRLFDGTLAPLGDEFAISTEIISNQESPAIDSDGSGNFVVAWTSDVGDGSYSSIHARRFDNTGSPYGPEFQVNTYTTGHQFEPDVAMSSNGFVVVWSSDSGQDGSTAGVFGQRYDGSGNSAGGEFQVNIYTSGDQRSPRIAMNDAGFVVVWQSAGQDGSGLGIFGRRYDASGNALGGEFQVNTNAIGDQTEPDVALDPAGDFVVVWASADQDGSAQGVFARRYDAAGGPLGSETVVNAYTTGAQNHPQVAIDPTGAFVVTWQSSGEDDPAAPDKAGVFAQRYSANGRRILSELRVNAYTTDNQQTPSIAMDSSGQFVIAWESYGQEAAGYYGLFARRAGFPQEAPMKVDERPSGGGSNVNGILESGERVTVDPAWKNRGAAALPLTGAASNLTGLAGPAYTIHDSSADYGTIASGGTNNCFDATANCYEVTVSGARPAAHWDATLDEALSAGVIKTWALHVGESFPDVPQTNLFYRFIENLFHNGVTGGCAGGNYCPSNPVTRAQMAVFLLKARFGSGYVPPAATGTVFGDVPASDPFAPWIENLAALAITGGCGGGNYCPGATVTRKQMAVFLLKTLLGSSYTPPPAAGIFGDVPASDPFAPWIEDLYARGITGGCQASPLLYCPNNPNNRGQMAVFLVKTFLLQLY